MKNKNKIKVLNVILFIIDIIIFVGLIILEKNHICEFNRPLVSRCSIKLRDIISNIHSIFTYIFYITLVLNLILSVFVLINKDNKKKTINFIILIISLLLIIFNIIITIFKNNQPMTVDKPMIYIYPTKNINLKIKLGNDKLLTSTYPKYKNGWNINVNLESNIYDYNTKRNYYALYWESVDDTIIDTTEGFVVEGENTVMFLEEKLEYLGLNEREIEEFIVYWLPQLENNKYNYIRFRTMKEINEYMPLYFNKKPDTIIRVIMDFKPLNKKIKVTEQNLISQKRKGFTIVEWGARKLTK